MKVLGQLKNCTFENFETSGLPSPAVPFRIVFNKTTQKLNIVVASAWKAYPSQLSEDSYPVGTVVPCASENTPSPGYLLLNDQIVLAADYNSLVSIAVAEGWFSDGGTPGGFLLPASFGRTLRVLDPSGTIDPNYSTRTQVIFGTMLFSQQGTAIGSHTHSIRAWTGFPAQSGGNISGFRTDTTQRFTNSSGGAESRTKNFYSNLMIKY